jgi:hypothetical protein
MIWKVIQKLVPFYFGILLGWLVFLEPKNAWIYGFFGGLFVTIFIVEEINREKE